MYQGTIFSKLGKLLSENFNILLFEIFIIFKSGRLLLEIFYNLFDAKSNEIIGR
jgi:hypothetical protein